MQGQTSSDLVVAVPLTIAARGVNGVGFDKLNVYARTSGIIPPDEDGRPQELPADLHAALRAAFKTLFVQDDKAGRAVIRLEYHCGISGSKSHPIGKCPALALEGWPPLSAMGDARRGRGLAAQAFASTGQGFPQRGAFQGGRGFGGSRGATRGRGAIGSRGFAAHGSAQFH
ncbi:hypothetical protein AURDEDRAFT_165085 [Auricularia subglabra TFB-10046 SS5]|nr:hypothetical protein AURDEDRAFT_165085 [Auricularia subglabra TFB-10046 SS5]